MIEQKNEQSILISDKCLLKKGKTVMSYFITYSWQFNGVCLMCSIALVQCPSINKLIFSEANIVLWTLTFIVKRVWYFLRRFAFIQKQCFLCNQSERKEEPLGSTICRTKIAILVLFKLFNNNVWKTPHHWFLNLCRTKMRTCNNEGSKVYCFQI